MKNETRLIGFSLLAKGHDLPPYFRELHLYLYPIWIYAGCLAYSPSLPSFGKGHARRKTVCFAALLCLLTVPPRLAAV